MWGRKRKASTAHNAEILAALEGQQLADDVIAKVESQQAEVTQRVTSLNRRERKNNFGLGLEIAMEARTQ